MNNHLYDKLREPLRGLLPDEEAYAKTFDRLEFLQAAVRVAVMQSQGDATPWFPIGRFGWRGRRWRGPIEVVDALTKEADDAGADWAPLRARLFRSRAEFDGAAAFIAKQVTNLAWG